MKTFLPIFFFFIFVSILSAQVQKGSFVTGGMIVYFSSTQDGRASGFNQGFIDDKSSQFEIAPALGYVLNENLVLGTFLSYAREERDIDFNSGNGGFQQTQTSKNNLFSLKPFLRYYKTVVDKFGLTFELNLRIGFGSGESSLSFSNVNNIDEVRNQFDVSEFSLGASPGIFYKLNNSFIIRANIGALSYLNRRESFEDGLNVPMQRKLRDFNLSLTDDLTLSFEYFFGGGEQ